MILLLLLWLHRGHLFMILSTLQQVQGRIDIPIFNVSQDQMLRHLTQWRSALSLVVRSGSTQDTRQVEPDTKVAEIFLSHLLGTRIIPFSLPNADKRWLAFLEHNEGKE